VERESALSRKNSACRHTRLVNGILIMIAYIRALKFHPRCCPIHEIGKRIAHFTKWADVLPITRNGQYACLFREIGNFTDWA